MNLLAQMAGAAGAQPAPTLVLGLPPLAWAVIVCLFVLLLVLIPTLSTSASRRAEAEGRRAKAARLKRFENDLNTVAAYPQPVEPLPLEHIRRGEPVPVPRSTSKLAEEVDALRAQVAGGTTVPLEGLQPRSQTLSTVGESSAGTSGSSANAPSVGQPAVGVSTVQPNPVDVTAGLLGRPVK